MELTKEQRLKVYKRALRRLKWLKFLRRDDLFLCKIIHHIHHKFKLGTCTQYEIPDLYPELLSFRPARSSNYHPWWRGKEYKERKIVLQQCILLVQTSKIENNDLQTNETKAN